MSNNESKGSNKKGLLLIGAGVLGAIGLGLLLQKSYKADQVKRSQEAQEAKKAKELEKEEQKKKLQIQKEKEASRKQKLAADLAKAFKPESPKTDTVVLGAPATTPAKIEEVVDSDTTVCSRDTLIKVFTDCANGMEHVIFQLASMQQTMQAQNPNMDMEELLQLLNEKYVASISEVQNDAFKKHDVTEKAVEAAGELYKDDKEYLALVAKIDRINQALLGAVPALDEEELKKIPHDLTVDKILDLFKEMTTVMMEAQATVVDEVIAIARKECQTAKLDSDKINSYRKMVIEKLQKPGGPMEQKDEIYAKFGTTEDVVKIAMQKYMEDPKLAQGMISIQNLQQTKGMDVDQKLKAALQDIKKDQDKK